MCESLILIFRQSLKIAGAQRPLNPAYPKEFKTVGDHLHKARLDRGLSQPQVPKVIGVTINCITV